MSKNSIQVPRPLGSDAFLIAALSVCLLLAAGACNSQNTQDEVVHRQAATRPAAPAIRLPTLADQKPLDYPGLHNVVAYAPEVLSGSAPEGDAGFASLKQMGIRSIVTVDGGEPEVATAKAYGMRYVHLPITYSGFDETRKLELAKAVRDLPKPIYLHCHHGKHRSAGAAGAAVVTLGWLSPAAAVERMKVSGTAPDYKGLYACTANATQVMADIIDALPMDFPEVVRPQGTVRTMVEIDIAAENLKAIQKAGWKAPANHTDLHPPAEAGRLADYYRFLRDASEATTRQGQYREWLDAAHREVSDLEETLLLPNPSKAELDAKFSAVITSCKTCHRAYRD